MRNVILAAASALCLMACATPQERAQQQQLEMERMMAEFGPACSQLGYAMQSDPWRDCVLQSAQRSGRSGISTSIFGGFGSGGRGSGIGIGIGIGR
ncbi:hypothetical protein LE190_02975 [Massilia oculi]|uniref:Lipoprotein n=2 Tax=Massilia TaxID=149698 RepID=A0ABS7Y5F1_9BURK|nr:hypothetical protein [Massilia oculi]MCA1854894.1 hypothetical protein [Massilia oculi]